MNSVEIKNLTHIYSQGTPFEKTAIDDVSLTVREGDYVGVIGHTGSGKSTLIQHLNGLYKPTSGQVFIEGEDIWQDKAKLREFRFKVGLVFQYPEYQLFGETIYQDIAFGPTNMGLELDEIDRRVKSAMSFVGLKESYMEKSPFELSGGQKRRVAIAGVIAMDPAVLVLDEPTAGLDPKGRDQILGQLKEYHQEKKNTVLLVSHSMEDIAKYANKAMVMNGGKLVEYDTVDKVFAKGERLVKMGLDVPQVSRVFSKLAVRYGWLDQNVYTVDKACEAIIKEVGFLREGLQ